MKLNPPATSRLRPWPRALSSFSSCRRACFRCRRRDSTERKRRGRRSSADRAGRRRGGRGRAPSRPGLPRSAGAGCVWGWGGGEWGGARGAAVLDLSDVGGDGEVGDEGVFGLAGAVRDDGGAPGAARKLDAVERLGERADLVDLDENRVGDAQLDAFAQELRVGDEEVVADELYARAQLVRQKLPALPVALAHAVFNRDDGILLGPTLPVGDHLGARQAATVRLLDRKSQRL